MVTKTAFTTEKTNSSPIDNQKRIEGHKRAAILLETAAKYHIEAAKHHEDGEHEKAALSTLKAHRHHYLASETQRENIKIHAMYS